MNRRVRHARLLAAAGVSGDIATRSDTTCLRSPPIMSRRQSRSDAQRQDLGNTLLLMHYAGRRARGRGAFTPRLDHATTPCHLPVLEPPFTRDNDPATINPGLTDKEGHHDASPNART